MPPVAMNPNPDRARRGASGAPAAEAKSESVPERAVEARNRVLLLGWYLCSLDCL